MAIAVKNKKAKKGSYSTNEKKSWKRGFFAGLYLGKKKKSSNGKKFTNNKTTPKTKSNSTSLLDKIKLYRQRNLGVLYHNGKYYDTNFIDKPHEISKSLIKDLHEDYNFDGKRSDIEVADSYVRHMRRKYGVFNKEGKFLHMIGEDE